MKTYILCCLAIVALACGKKEWPQPIASEELLFIDHLEARREGGCLRINAKLGGNLHNLVLFEIELEQGGCPTCPFAPTSTYTLQPFSKAVQRRENNFVLTLCPPLNAEQVRLRVKANNQHAVVDPGISQVITLGPSLQ